jgi:DNA-binding CsgD family transcriptional regulator
MVYSSNFDDLIKSIYLASSGLEDINYFLDCAGKVFNSHLVGCIQTDKFDLSTSMPFFKGVSERDKENYNNYYADKNVLITVSVSDLLDGKVVTSAENFTDAELRKTEFYAGYMKHLEAQYTAGFMLASTSDAFYTLIVCRPQALGAYSPEEKRMLDALRSHAVPAMQIHSHLNSLRSLIKISSHALDRLNVGVCALGNNLKVLGANTAASEILEKGEFLSTQAGILTGGRLTDPKLSRLLHNMSAGKVTSSEQLRISGALQGSEYVLSVFPVLDAEEFWWMDSKQARYVLFIDTQLKPGGINLDFLRKEFALTQRELDVLGQLVMGRSLTSAARHLHMSHETARTHMKRIFTKMDVHSQAQLAVKVLSLSSVS